MCEAHVVASRRWRGLLSEAVAAFETTGFGHEARLFPEERELVARAVASRVAEFAAGRACARQALAALGYPLAPLLRSDDRRPAWPRGCFGSITHAEGHCAAAVARASACAGLGIDVEVAGSVDERLERQICTPAEIRLLRSMAKVERAASATVMFSAKEAFYKSQSHLPDAIWQFHDVEIELGDGVFAVRLRRMPEGLRRLDMIRGRYAAEDGLVYSAVLLR